MKVLENESPAGATNVSENARDGAFAGKDRDGAARGATCAADAGCVACSSLATRSRGVLELHHEPANGSTSGLTVASNVLENVSPWGTSNVSVNVPNADGHVPNVAWDELPAGFRGSGASMNASTNGSGAVHIGGAVERGGCGKD